MKTCLVTGGAGFIGSHLCDLLMSRGFKVVCLDDLITGSQENVVHLQKEKRFSFLKADVIFPNLEIEDVDYIFHLASPASPLDYQNYPEETLLVNSLGTLKMLKLAAQRGPKILIASTSEVYGDPHKHPQKETYWGNVNSFGPRSCYDESKRFAEAATYVYLHKYGVDARIVRIFNTYGPRMQMDDGRVVSNFIVQALTGVPLTVYGEGTQTRSFCYIADMALGIYQAMFTPKTKGEIFNLGNPEEVRVIDLAQKIMALTKTKSKIIYKLLPIDDPQKRRPDIAKAKRILGWEPKVKIEEGLRETIKYYREKLRNEA